MADLGGGHPADVLIAVRLAAQALTVPGMERGGRAAWRMDRGGGGCAAREEPRLETKWPGRRGGDARVPWARLPVPGKPREGGGAEPATGSDGGFCLVQAGPMLRHHVLM